MTTKTTLKFTEGQLAYQAKMKEVGKQHSLAIWTKIAEVYPYKKKFQSSIRQAAKDTGIKNERIADRTEMFKKLGLVQMDYKPAGNGQSHTDWFIMKKKWEGLQLIEEFYDGGGSHRDFEGHSGQHRVSAKMKAQMAAEAAALAEAERIAKEEEARVEAEIAAQAEAERLAVEEAAKAPVLDEHAAVPEAVYIPVHEDVTVRRENGEAVEAIAGPDAPKPFAVLRSIRKDEAGALLEAVRQYSNRYQAVFSKFEELEKLGIKIDRALVMQGVQLETNEQFEAILPLLPYITELESKVGQITEWKSETVNLRREVGQLRDMYNREKDANKRLSEKNAQIVASRGN